jgi:GNAT superfamily N-acetyltransferase
MDHPNEVLALYDAEMRRDPVPDPGSRVERVGRIVRVVGPESYILYSDLTEADVMESVAAQAEFFQRLGREVEWKAFGHDRPANLEAVLASAGFTPDEPETLVVFDLRDGVPGENTAPGVEVHAVTDEMGVRDAVIARDAAFGPEEHDSSARYARVLKDPNQALFVAYADGKPVASGRIEMTPGRSFASLWGGGTAPGHRRRGIYRSLVHARATLAAGRGYRFLTVDARETSRPILERLGFVPLTTTRGWVLRPRAGGSGEDKNKPP